jgi:ABC-type multidrug transport system ATPase subunit
MLLTKQALILELGLKDVADTRCGGRHGRGISGGEARRVTTAVQLVTDPALLFCDEPSTGLDAFSTLSLVETLAAVAARGRTVVCTLHQPRADVLSLFHASLLLSKGRAVYFGPAADMVPHFAALGHACPVHTNAGDFLLDLSSVDMRTPAAEAATRATVARLLDAWADRAEQQTGSIDGTQGAGGGGFGGGAGAGGDDALASLLSGVPRAVAASRRAQTAALLSRGALNAARDVRTLGGLLLECVAVGLSIGGIFFRIGGTPSDMVSRASLAHLVCSAQAYQFMVFSLHVVAAELAVYDHETADGMYGVVAFLTARYAVLLPHLLVFPTIFALIVFFMAGLRHEGGGGGALPMFLAVVIAAHAISFSLALACTATHRSFAQASLMANLFFIFCRLTSGLLMQLGSVPYWLAWVKRISFLNFTYRIIAVNEFSHHTWPCPEATPAACVSYDGDATLKRLGVSHDVADAAVALVVEFLALVLLTAAALAWRPRVEARAQALMLAVRLGGARDVDDAAPGTSATASAEERLAAAAAVPVHLDEGAVAALHALAPALDSLAELHFRAFTPVTVGLRDVGLSLLPPRAWRRGQRREEGKVLLRSITLTLRPGQLTGVLGASGSGKSSLLNTLAARVLPGEGTVSGAMLFNGVLLRPAATRAVVGYVTQHDALMPMLTVFETMHFAARLRLPEVRLCVCAMHLCAPGLARCACTHFRGSMLMAGCVAQDMCAVAKLARVETVLAELGLKARDACVCALRIVFTQQLPLHHCV